MENQTKTYLTRSELIEKLLALPAEYENAPIVFSYVDGNEESGEKIKSVNIFQVISTNTISLDENIPIIVITNNPEGIEKETLCECEECIAQREEMTDDESTEEALNIQGMYLDALEEAGLKDWKGFDYAMSIFKDNMMKEGYDESNFQL